MAGTEGGGGMAREEYRDGTAAAVLRWRGWDSTFIPRCRLLTYCYACFTKEVEYRSVYGTRYIGVLGLLGYYGLQMADP